MMRDHERIEELLAGHALEGLDETDERALADALAEHGPDCAECRVLEREHAEIAGLLAFSLSPVAADPAIADRILGSSDAGTTVRTARLGTTMDATDEPAARRERPRRSRTGAWTALAGVAAIVVALVVVAGTVVRSPVEITRADLSGRLVRFETPDGDAGPLVMAYTPGESGAVFWGEGLPDPGEGQTFEIWMIDDGTPIPGGCAAPVDGRIALFVDAEIGTTDTMAVTVEPTDCPAEPTTDPVLLAPL